MGGNDGPMIARVQGAGRTKTRSRQIALQDEVHRLEVLHPTWTRPQLGAKLGITDRYVRDLVKQRNDRLNADANPVKLLEDMPPELRATMEFSPEGFTAFHDRYAGGKKLPPHMVDWVTRALKHNRVLINCPPRHGKSWVFSNWLPVWLICMDRNVQIIILSSSQNQAKKWARFIDIQLRENKALIADFGRFIPLDATARWSVGQGEFLVEGRHRVTLPGDFTVMCRGAGQAVLGAECDWLIADDVVDRDDVNTRETADKLARWFKGDAMTRLEPEGHAVVIGQRLGLMDLYGELAADTVVTADGGERKVWEHLNYQAVSHYPTDTEPEPIVLWPEKWSFDYLQERKADITRKQGEGLWATMFQQEPYAETDVLVPMAWIAGDEGHIGCLDAQRRLGEGIPPAQRRCRVLSLDPSPTQYAGLICADIGLGQDLRLEIVDVVREKMTVQDMLLNLTRMHQAYGPIHYLILETNSSAFFKQSKDFQDWLAWAGCRLISHTTSINKQHHENGVSSLGVECQRGTVRFPYAGPDAQRVMGQLIYELTTYPFADTDDLLMALWFIKYNWRRLPPVASVSKPPRSGPSFHVPERLAGGFGWAKEPAIA